LVLEILVKSTFLKQLKVINNRGFSSTVLRKYKDILQLNCLVSIQRLIACEKFVFSDSTKMQREKVLECHELNDCVNEVCYLWKDSSVKECFDLRNELGIIVPSLASYYFENTVRFADAGFIPTSEDILRAKMKTTGVTDMEFQFNGNAFTVYDVGGQRSERRKWIHCFDDVESILFLAALDEYDMKLEEDNTTCRFSESLKLFEEVSGSSHFRLRPNVSWVLFLNKIDLFMEKLKSRPLSRYFPDYNTPQVSDPSKNYENSFKFIENKYITAFKGVKIYSHATCALDTENCRKVFMAVLDTAVAGALASSGLM